MAIQIALKILMPPINRPQASPPSMHLVNRRTNTLAVVEAKAVVRHVRVHARTRESGGVGPVFEIYGAAA